MGEVALTGWHPCHRGGPLRFVEATLRTDRWTRLEILSTNALTSCRSGWSLGARRCINIRFG